MKRTLLLLPLVLAAGCGAGGGQTATPSTSAAASPAASTSGSAAPATADPAVSTQAPVQPEKNPPGDIPDNLAFVPYSNTDGRYTFTHPEGWTQITSGATVTFTDKLNGVQVSPGEATTVPTVADAKQTDVSALARTQPAFELRDVTTVTEPGGKGVRIVYRRNSAPDEVTGRQYRDEVERYELVSGGREVIVELYGPVGADNVDAYATMITSLTLS